MGTVSGLAIEAFCFCREDPIIQPLSSSVHPQLSMRRQKVQVFALQILRLALN